MGTDAGFRCNSCGHRENYWTGVGLSGPYLRFKEDDNEYKKIMSMVEKLRDKDKDVYVDLYTEIHLCDECGFIDSRNSVIVKSEDWDYIYKYNCPKCDNKLREIDIKQEVESMICPKCKEQNLSFEATGVLWD